ncbi:phage distal tail protein [Streptomyces acidiscabies]|uniref:Phage tail family protein n=1 Tax=Streptomyces acidiscabies TaxID=42234 RepID=A0AAP6EHH0_9ACTN|nr:phage tail domain-containing protein [Streptomyces acidiscabies]MBZ3909427.1 phage tail family protein [Streptomyces acidiscabies]MDX2962405.1 phage tail family protein [Streptomyces acidiscabies]MDX3792424.1 phage tail family protein [Streptomyces acidiscabies]
MAQQRLGNVQWGDLLIGPGTPYAVTAVEGLDDLPDIRAEDVERPGQHGDYTGPDYTGPRTIQLKLGIRGDSPDDLRALTLALRAATQPQAQPATLQFIDQGTLVYGKVRRRNLPYDAEALWRIGDAAIEWYCADPYLYGLEERSESTTAYSPSAGRTYPMAYPRSYGSAGTSGRLTAVNGGASPAYPVLRLDGPVSDPAVEQVTNGGILQLDADLQAGEYVLIDTRSRAVLYMGTAPRRAWVRAGSVWPLLTPGPNELAYRGSSLPGSPGQESLLTVTWRDTSL